MRTITTYRKGGRLFILREMAILRQLRACLTGALLLDACECCSNHDSVAVRVQENQKSKIHARINMGRPVRSVALTGHDSRCLRMTIRSMHLCARGGLQPSAPLPHLVSMYILKKSRYSASCRYG